MSSFFQSSSMMLIVRTKITSIENGFERINFPMCFVYWCPHSNLVQNSLYASTKGRMIEALEVMKVWLQRCYLFVFFVFYIIFIMSSVWFQFRFCLRFWIRNWISISFGFVFGYGLNWI
jgi:hypothetical protein